MSWLIWAVCAPVESFEPVAPAYACNTSALSESALVVLVVSEGVSNRSVMPTGTPIPWLSEPPKQATSIVLPTVVVIDGAERPAAPPEALMGAVVSTLKYALIPPATEEEGETLKV